MPLILAGLALKFLLAPEQVIGHVVAAAGALLMHGMAWAYRRIRRRHGLGPGDAKLFAAARAWAGPMGLPTILLIASVGAILTVLMFAVIMKRPVTRYIEVPFGLFLSLGIWITWPYGPSTLF